jgi:acetylornithine deacetylase/succinyl-diaminopimelate desuccinylase-like protein
VFALGGVAQMHQPDEFIEVTALSVGLGFLDRLLTDMRTPL